MRRGLSLPFVRLFSKQAGFTADWNKAKEVHVTVDQIAFDQMQEAEFQKVLLDIEAHDPDNFYYRDLTVNGRLIMNKAFRLSGVTVTAKYTPEQLKDLKTKYPEGGSLTVGGDKGSTVTFSYGSEDTLMLRAAGSIYVAGEFARLQGGEVALTGAGRTTYKLVPVDSKDGIKLQADPISPMSSARE